MPADGKSRRRTTRGWPSRDGRRALAICLLFGAIASVGLATVVRNMPSSGTRIAATKNAQGDDELTTGSIVFVPILGNHCRSRLIDNATWRIRDNGMVDCKVALNPGAAGRGSGWSAARVDVIRHGFSHR
jgi:hypothetical protein